MTILEEHLEECKFDKYFKKLVKKLKGKSVILYGTGMLFELVKEKYDLSEINITAVSDIKYFPQQEGEKDFGYKILPYDKFVDETPDVILLGVKNYHDIMEDFREDVFYKKPIEIIPLVKVPFLKRLKDIIFE